jgi:hypothetical protein
VEAKRAAEAAKPPTVCKKCGNATHDCKHHVCTECRYAAWQVGQDEIRRKIEERKQRPPRESTVEQPPASAAQDASTTDAASDPAMALLFAVIPFLSKGKTEKPKPQPKVEEVLPEWVDHAEQDRIDAIASRLLEEWAIEL